MSEFAFLFYPGDYLRDTQCLSEKTQVAYDRIMCEHMRNICIRQTQLNFFTKNLTEDEKAELKSVLIETEDGFYIEWVHASINKRKAYSDSRRQNRLKKTSKTHDEHMLSYDKHMEIEKEKEIVIDKEEDKEEKKERKKNKILSKEKIKEVITKIDNIQEHDLQKFIQAKCPNISKVAKQLSFDEAEKIWTGIDHQVLESVLSAMENKAGLSKAYTSVYLTIINWAKNQKSHGKINSNSSENRFADLERQLEASLQGVKIEI